MRQVTMFLSGALFSAGLVIAGMTQPGKVVGFLDLTGNWDPSLAFVMVGAISVHLVLYRVILRRPSPLLAGHFRLPQRQDIDRRLIVGSAIFGLGWGLAGYCPGPGLVAAGAGSHTAILFVAAMALGMALFVVFEHVQQHRSRSATRRGPHASVERGEGSGCEPART